MLLEHDEVSTELSSTPCSNQLPVSSTPKAPTRVASAMALDTPSSAEKEGSRAEKVDWFGNNSEMQLTLLSVCIFKLMYFECCIELD